MFLCWREGVRSGHSVSWTLKTDPGLKHNPIWNLWQPPRYFGRFADEHDHPSPSSRPKEVARTPPPQLGEEGWGCVNGDHPTSHVSEKVWMKE